MDHMCSVQSEDYCVQYSRCHSHSCSSPCNIPLYTLSTCWKNNLNVGFTPLEFWEEQYAETTKNDIIDYAASALAN